jgi:hypothetical protein
MMLEPLPVCRRRIVLPQKQSCRTRGSNSYTDGGEEIAPLMIDFFGYCLPRGLELLF